MVFQDPNSSLDPSQTIGHAIAEALELHFPDRGAGWRADRVEELLERVGLDERHRTAFPRRLSGGEKQRAAIARALAVEPRLLILDEAVSALDVSVQAHVLNLLAGLRASLGLTYLFISHDLGVVRQVSDDTIVMRRGQVMERGPTHRFSTTRSRTTHTPSSKPYPGPAGRLAAETWPSERRIHMPAVHEETIMNDNDDLAWRSATEISDLYRTGQVSPVEVVEAVLAQLERCEPTINTFVTVTAEQALRQARAAAERLASRSGFDEFPRCLVFP